MDICAANNHFAVDAFQEISRNAVGQNAVFSPLSIFSILSMVLMGTGGSTAAQIRKAIHFKDVKDVHVEYKNLWEMLEKKSDGHILINANRLFGQKSFELFLSFLENTKNLYGAGMEQLDFHNDSEKSRQFINNWISQKTNGKIQQLLPQQSILPSTALVAVNTLYFAANWTKQFRESRTREATFTLLSNEQVTVQMMTMTNYFKSKYIENPGLKIVELPYGTKEDFSMVIMIPDNNVIFDKVNKMISYENLNAWISSTDMKMANIALQLPRLKVEKKISLKETLKSMGIIDAFNQVNANFSGMTNQHNMFMSEVYHQTSLEVNEQGTEASSSTGAVMSFRSLPNDEIKANRPFYVVIRHNHSNCILLYGVVNKP
ncbi:PREDICTED: serpin B8-like [Nanorana parkeri]|uniref:serpin B8-like n=1 Tax=Nanorana parkeri TaxID=125878 RepID=UPI0008545B4A|nr:PREDICTED: serpin B8-like [Nanorana parkeri]